MLDQERAQKQAEAQRIANAICALIEKEQHAVTLDALLSVYKALAKKFECCTQTASDVCMATALELAWCAAQQRKAIAAGQQPSASPQHLH